MILVGGRGAADRFHGGGRGRVLLQEHERRVKKRTGKSSSELHTKLIVVGTPKATDDEMLKEEEGTTAMLVQEEDESKQVGRGC